MPRGRLSENDLKDFFKPSVRAMAAAVGVQRIRSDYYDAFAETAQANLEEAIRRAILVAEKRKTISLADVNFALNTPYSDAPDRPCRRSGEKNYDCYFMPRRRVEVLIRRLGDENRMDLRWAPDAIGALHNYTEQYMLKILRLSHESARVRGRGSIDGVDLQLILAARTGCDSL